MTLNYLANIASLQLTELYDEGYPKILLTNDDNETDLYLKKTLIGLVFQGHRILHDNLYFNFEKFIPYLEYLMTNWNTYQEYLFYEGKNMNINFFYENIRKYYPNIIFSKRHSLEGFFLFSKKSKTNTNFEKIFLEIHYPVEINQRTIYLWFEYLRAMIVLNLNYGMSKEGYILFEPCFYGTQALKEISENDKYVRLKENYENYFGKKIFENMGDKKQLFFNFYQTNKFN